MSLMITAGFNRPSDRVGYHAMDQSFLEVHKYEFILR